MKTKRRQKGYTLIELAVIMVIFVILAAMITRVIINSSRASLENEARAFSGNLELMKIKAIGETYEIKYYLSSTSYTIYQLIPNTSPPPTYTEVKVSSYKYPSGITTTNSASTFGFNSRGFSTANTDVTITFSKTRETANYVVKIYLGGGVNITKQ